MSVDATQWAWKIVGIKSSVKMVLLAMADRAGEDHTCYPSIMRLEKDTCLDDKTITTAISKLIELGLIIDTGNRVGTTKKVRVFKLIGVEERHTYKNPKKEESSECTQNRSYSNAPENGCLNAPENGCLNAPENGCLNAPENGCLNAPENGLQNLSIEPNKEYRKEKIQKEKNQDLYLLNDFGITGQLASDFILHRRQKKAPITRTALDGLRREAGKAGITIAQAVTAAIERNWQGFKADWVLNNKHLSGNNGKYKPSYETILSNDW
jgi:hypothetical protein